MPFQNKFTSLSLAFKTDKLTLTNRLELQQRQRDIAEKNIDVEIAQLKKEVEVGGPFLSISVVLGFVMGFQTSLNYLGYVLIPPTNLDSLIWHDSQHLFHFWQIEYWATEDSCKVEYWDLADLHHGIEPNLK